ncbi:MAG: hypothetical protein GC185_12055 [Alphaproteobacteria bacterium]|nr:hypothetical protein [Alphaproteobacteria bacterium]
MTKPAKTPNTEELLKKLADETEAQIDALRSTKKGIARTFAASALHSVKGMRAAKQLADALDLPAEDRSRRKIYWAIADKVEAQKVPGAERFRALMNWNSSFWSQPEAKAADHDLNPVRSGRTLKELAHKQPKP